MKKALTLRMFPDEMPTLQRLDLAREAGFDGIEINLEPWQEYSLDTDPDELAMLRKEVEARGLQVTAVYDREQWHFPMSSPDSRRRDRCRVIVERLGAAAALLGADTVLVMPGAVDNSILAPEPELVPYDEAYVNSQETLVKLAASVGDRFGVHLAIENCPSKFLVSPLEFARFLDQIGSSWVNAYFDTGNALWYGYPEHWISILGSRIRRIHLKDNYSLPGGGVVAAPLLAGDVNWPEVCGALERVGYDSWLTAEVLPPYRYHAERLIHETSASIDAVFGRNIRRSAS